MHVALGAAMKMDRYDIATLVLIVTTSPYWLAVKLYRKMKGEK